MIRIGVATLAAGIWLAAGALARGAEADEPAQIVQNASNEMLKDLDAHRAEYRKDPRKVYALVDRVLLPHFDTEYAAQQVLAKNWRTATPDQRKRFINAFYQSLLRNYGTALLDFT
ncbi:MAG: MlaC/ttg2D family ABC transporter substrate-binding protein, partial [Steroidobacterales bacterium]